MRLLEDSLLLFTNIEFVKLFGTVSRARGYNDYVIGVQVDAVLHHQLKGLGW